MECGNSVRPRFEEAVLIKSFGGRQAIDEEKRKRGDRIALYDDSEARVREKWGRRACRERGLLRKSGTVLWDTWGSVSHT